MSLEKLLDTGITFFSLLLTLLFGGSISNDTQVPMAPSASTTAQVLQVIDGDTIDVRMEGETKNVRVRYIGVDTPEPYATKVPECGSDAATLRNQELVGGQEITIVPGADPYDDYDRLLAYVYVGDTFVNQTLVAEGYATVMMFKPNTQYKTEFTTLYNQARSQKLGIWAGCA